MLLPADFGIFCTFVFYLACRRADKASTLGSLAEIVEDSSSEEIQNAYQFYTQRIPMGGQYIYCFFDTVNPNKLVSSYFP